MTDRYTKAIEQLGSDKSDVRIGGIYALERIARDSARDHPVVMEVLTAFIREHSREEWPMPAPDGQKPKLTRPDVQAALTVVVRRDAKRDIIERDIYLTGARLRAANFYGARLRHAHLYRADSPARTSNAPTLPTPSSPTPTSAARTSARLTSPERTSATLTSAARTSQAHG